MATEAKIKSALTREEWARKETAGDHGCVAIDDVTGDVYMYPHGADPVCDIHDRHGAAALCLHGQPFGFTREDAGALRGLCSELLLGMDPCGKCQLCGIAARIEALLPPEE